MPELPEGAEGFIQEESEGPMGGGRPFKRIQGKIYIMDGDEYITEDDPKGDTKIDKNGDLLGGEYPFNACLPVGLNV